MKDPIIEEVRRHRMEHTAKFRGDLAAICTDLQSVQRSSGYEVVRLAPKKAKPTRAYSRRSGAHG